MGDPIREVRDQAEDILRRAVATYGDNVARYGKALADFGKGEADVIDFAKAGVDIAVRGAQSVVENGWALNEAYYNWILGLSGGKPTGQSPRQAREPSAASKKPTGHSPRQARE